MNDLILYGDPRSTYVRTARMACEEKGVDYSLEAVDLAAPAHRRVHPFGAMPAAKHVDRILFETSAICHYVDEAFDGPPLRPQDAYGRAQVEQWISATVDYLYEQMARRYILQFVFPSGPGGQPDTAVIDAARGEVARQLAILDHHLQRAPFLVGDELTLADLFVHPLLYYLIRMPGGQELLEPYGFVLRSLRELEYRRSFVATAPPL